MAERVTGLYTIEDITELKKQSEELKTGTLIEIERLKKELKTLERDTKAIDEWFPKSREVEVYTMERIPTLSESIRRIYD